MTVSYASLLQRTNREHLHAGFSKAERKKHEAFINRSIKEKLHHDHPDLSLDEIEKTSERIFYALYHINIDLSRRTTLQKYPPSEAPDTPSTMRASQVPRKIKNGYAMPKTAMHWNELREKRAREIILNENKQDTEETTYLYTMTPERDLLVLEDPQNLLTHRDINGDGQAISLERSIIENPRICRLKLIRNLAIFSIV